MIIKEVLYALHCDKCGVYILLDANQGKIDSRTKAEELGVQWAWSFHGDKALCPRCSGNPDMDYYGGPYVSRRALAEQLSKV
jgi:hypothetical protein